MIVVDASALVAILRAEDDASLFNEALLNSEQTVIGAPSKFELMLVMAKRQGEPGVADAKELLLAHSVQTVDWSDSLVAFATKAFIQYGKGQGHPAQLNFGDCMAYALAKSLHAPLLYKGDDFALTDITSALQS